MTFGNRWAAALAAIVVLGVVSTASAQSGTGRWNVEFGVGWDNSISGNINSGAAGTLGTQTVVFLKNTYEDVYGTGLHLRFGGGFEIDEMTEARVTFTLQSLDADLTSIGEYGAGNLYGQYSDYQAFTLDVGLRRYGRINPSVRPYAEALVGLGFLDEIDLTLVAPRSNITFEATDFYDSTTAFTFSLNGGAVWDVNERVGVFGQLGLRYVTGLSDVDNLVGTGLEDVNDKSARWTVPFLIGVRVGF